MDCLFCKIIHKEIPCDVLYEDEQLLAFNDISPQAPTHILIIPKKHITDLNTIVEDDDIALIGKMVYRAKLIAKAENVDKDSFRLVFNTGILAGQTVFHLHLHLLANRKMQWPPG